MPRSGYTWLSTVETGEWTVYGAEEVTIPAAAAIRNGIWFPILQDVRGLIAEAGGLTAAYMFVQLSTYYF